MRIGYARTSTADQQAGFDQQQQELKESGCEKLFIEQVSALQKQQQLENALEYIRDNDTIVVTRLDRLARSTANLVKIIQILEQKGAHLQVLDLGVDTATPTGRLLLNLLGSIAQFEREIMLERQREGIARAKAVGKYKGRKPTARAKSNEIISLKAEGLGATAIARKLGIGRASVYRVFNDTKRSTQNSSEV